MNREDDRSYYARRAQQERKRADAAPDPAVRGVHRKLAAEYERRAEPAPVTR